ncbi:YggS family pyridoxal phosphate enzyme, partial [Fischerella thermalis CCMEE 5196]
MSGSISERINTVRAQLPPSVRLIAVTKQVPSDVIRAAYTAGIRDFGENRIQEAIAKQAELQDLSDITWHFIGHLQS